MLKWAVGGHHQARVEPPCCSAIRRPPFKRAKRNNQTINDKENENGSGSRDSSVYMRLEAVPVALRDVSNHQTPPGDAFLSPKLKRQRTCSSPTKLEVEKKIMKEEKKKLPCAVEGHGLNRLCLDIDRSLFQIEYTPSSRLVPRSPNLDDPVYFLNHSPSPVELDHKEIPLEQRRKDIILQTPGRLILQDSTLLSDSTPRTSGVSPLARRFAFLELSRAHGSDMFESPAETPLKPCPSFLSTTATIPMPLLPSALPESETLKAWVEANRHLETTPLKVPSNSSSSLVHSRVPASIISENSSANTFIVKDELVNRITNATNHDRNSTSTSCESLEFKSPIFESSLEGIKVKPILVNRYSSLPSISETGLVDSCSRKRRGVVFNDNTFELNTPPSEEERASASTWSVDACAPSTLKRMRVIRRRRERRRHPISDLSSNRLGLTIPDGIPSPPSPVDLAHPLCSPGWESAKLSDSLTPAQSTSSTTKAEYEADSSSTGSSMTISPIGTESDSASSRRCLLFSSPQYRLSRRGNILHSPRPGELELSISYKEGLLTINVIRGRNLQALSGPCNAYVKVCLVGCGAYRRTNVKKDSTNPRFDQSFSFPLNDEDIDRRILVSAWHRDRSNRKSEFLGCMSFAVRNAIKKDIQGRYRLLSQGSGRLGHLPANTNNANSTDLMANQSESSVEELVSVDESDVPPTPEQGKERKRLISTRKDYGKVIEDYIFLRYLELDPVDDEAEAGGTSSNVNQSSSANQSNSNRRGRTPFTTTRTLRRQPGASFGFSIAWTHPPRVERVESGLPADQAGLRPGDYIVFVEKSNVVTMKEEQILEIIKACGNQIVLESYRKSPAAPGARPLSHPGAVAVSPRYSGNACSTAPCSANACSTATTASLDVSKRKLHFPHVTFTSEVGSGILV